MLPVFQVNPNTARVQAAVRLVSMSRLSFRRGVILRLRRMDLSQQSKMARLGSRPVLWRHNPTCTSVVYEHLKKTSDLLFFLRL